MNRRFLPIVIAALTALTVAAPAASATGVDPEVVAQAIAEDGYYIDSGARYLKTDAAQDRLRSELERARSPVFVAVVPAGTTLSPAQVYRLAKRKGTYAVLNGGSLRAASNTLSASRVNGALAQAVKTHRGDPGGATVAFVGLTNGARRSGAGQGQATVVPVPSAPATAPSTDASAAASAAPASGQSAGNSTPLLVGGLVALVLAVGTGYLVYRKGRGSEKAI
jgi:hypothetical protein